MKQSAQYPFCEICPIVEDPSAEEQARRLYEGEHWLVTLRQNQSLPGSAYITSQLHVARMGLLSLGAEKELVGVRRKLEHAAMEAFDATNVNFSFLMNNAFRPQETPGFTPQPHVHGHFFPRYDGERQLTDPDTNETVTFTDPEFGNYLRDKREQTVSPAISRLIMAGMREHFVAY